MGKRATGASAVCGFERAPENQVIYLLDTNVCIHLLNAKHTIILHHFRPHIWRESVFQM